MTMYGDLDVSVIDELPRAAARSKRSTTRMRRRLKLFGFMRRRSPRGRQVLRRLPAHQGVRGDGLQGPHGRLRSHLAGFSAAAVRHGDLPRQDEARRQGGVDAPVQVGRGPDPRGDIGDRGGRRCAQRHGHGHRIGRTLPGSRSSTSCAGAWAAAANSPTAS